MARGAVPCVLRPGTGGSFVQGVSGRYDHEEFGRLRYRLQPLPTSEMPLDRAPPRSNWFGSRLVLSRVHWVRPELVVEVKCLTWTEDNLLRQVAYEGLREDRTD